MALERASTQRSRSFRADMTVVMATVVSTAVANTRHYFGATIARGEHGEQALGLGCHRLVSAHILAATARTSLLLPRVYLASLIHT